MASTVIASHNQLKKKESVKTKHSSLSRRLSKRMLRKVLGHDYGLIKGENKFKPDDQSSNFDGIRGTDIAGDTPPDSSSDN